MSESATLHPNQSRAFSFERYETKCDRSMPNIRVALGIIVALGIALALTAHFASLNRAFVYLGVTLSVASLIAITVLFIAQKNNLRTALNSIKSFAELKAIIDTVTVSHQSWYRCNCGENDDLEIRSSKLSGGVLSSELHHKIENMLTRPQTSFDDGEKELAKQINQNLTETYGALDSNETPPSLRKYL